MTKECASMPDGGRASACSCVLDGKAYIFGGRDEKGTYLSDLWEYDPKTDNWTDLGTTPLKARVNATIAAVDGKIYVGLGYSTKKAYYKDAYMRDWWSYTPETDTWVQLAEYPTANTVAVSSFVVEGNIYALYGFGFGYTKDVYRYNVSENSWSQVADNNEREWMNFGSRGALCGGRLYFGLGYRISTLNHWFEVDLPTNTWTPRHALPGKGRVFAACAATDKEVYILGGRFFAGEMTGGEVFDSYLRYSPDKDEWTWCGTMPCGRAENQVAFTLNGKVYFGLGEDENGHVHNTLYRIE